MPLSRKHFLKQTGIALAGSLIPLSKLFAETKKKLPVLDEYHPGVCSVNMTNEVSQYTYSTNTSTSQISVLDGFYSKPDGGSNNTNTFNYDVMYDLEGDLPDEGGCNPETDPNEYTCDYVDIFGANPFRYKVYYPKIDLHNYETTPLPCIVFFHAGGFQECPSYELPIIRKLCIQLSQRGFVCFTVEYRRGRRKDQYDDSKTTVQQQMAAYRAIQDGCGAIRSIIKKNRDSVSSGGFPFKINESQFFVGGTSAGGIIANACAYYRTSDDFVTQSQIDQVYKKATGSSYTIKQVLGRMHSDYYYAPLYPANSEEDSYWPIIKGVACMWGGIQIPKSYDGNATYPDGDDVGAVEKNFFPNSTTWSNPPMIAFHGAGDITIYFDDDSDQDIDLSEPPVGTQVNYNSDAACTLGGKAFQQYTDPNDAVELKVCSSLNLYNILRKRNRWTELYVDCSMGHGLDADCQICPSPPTYKNKDDCALPCLFASDFGIGSQSSDEVVTYMAQRIAVFFQSILNYISTVADAPPPKNYRGQSLFVDCENFRICENTTSNNAGCGNTLCNNQTLNLE